jgi:hypothetical protein
MPKAKDLKRIVRSRMEKTGESYTAARARVTRKKAETLDVSLAGLSDERVLAATGRGWVDWVALLDQEGGRTRPHGELARWVSSIGTPDWWSQMVVVGYERIRGVRAYGQRMDKTWEVSRSRTLNAPLSTVFEALADADQRAQWLTGLAITRAASTKNKSVRLTCEDGTKIDLRLTVKGEKTILGIGHVKMPSKEHAEQMKTFWDERLAALKAMVE